MTDDIDYARRREIAAQIISKHIARMQENWVTIESVDRQFPDAPTGKKDGKGGGAAAAQEQRPVDVSRVDLRVGLIVKAEKHPSADSLYVEDIDCGEDATRVVVSGLVKHIPEPEMQNRLVVVVANLKPANLKGIKSHAMVLAATGADGKVGPVTLFDMPQDVLHPTSTCV